MVTKSLEQVTSCVPLTGVVEKWAKPVLGCVIWEPASARQNLECVFIHVLDYTRIDLHDVAMFIFMIGS